MDCYNHSCPFRVNETSNAKRCECVACQNRSNSDFIITSNRTLTNDELEILSRKRNVLPMAETELSPCEYGEARKDDDVEDISELDDLFYDYDWCYECEGYGDDYYIDEHGEWVSACDDCTHNNTWSDDDD